MVKGVTRRVIVVKEVGMGLFEEAIFIVREDVFKNNGATSDEIVKQAREVADLYIKTNKGGFIRKIPRPVYAILGAAVTGAAWLITYIV